MFIYIYTTICICIYILNSYIYIYIYTYTSVSLEDLQFFPNAERSIRVRGLHLVGFWYRDEQASPRLRFCSCGRVNGVLSASSAVHALFATRVCFSLLVSLRSSLLPAHFAVLVPKYRNNVDL